MNQLNSRIWQHHVPNSSHIFIFMTTTIYFYYLIVNTVNGCVVFVCFCITSPRGCRFNAETCSRVHVYGWFMILHELCATDGVYETHRATTSLLAELSRIL
jgi:hypothetical protein